MQLWAEILRIASSAQRGAALAFEIQRGGVEEGNRECAEQRPPVVVERFFDHLGAAACLVGLPVPDVLTQPRHRLVRMIERQRIGPRYMHAVLPGAGVAIGAGY